MVSLRGQFFNWYFTLIGFKNGMAKDIKRGDRRAAQPKPKVMKRNAVKTQEFEGRKLWYLHPKSGETANPKKIVIFFHGGAYFYDVMDVHFPAWAKIADLSGALVVLPSYPLAPDFTPAEITGYAQNVMKKFRKDFPAAKLIVGGDSAGGGLALQLCQTLERTDETQPDHLILWSPWVDVSRDSSALIKQDKRSTVIGLKSSQIAAKLYAGDVDVKDPSVSPTYGRLGCLPPMTITTGSRDLLYPDIKRFAEKAKAAGASTDLQVWPEQNHYFMYLPQPEAAQVYKRTAALIKSI